MSFEALRRESGEWEEGVDVIHVPLPPCPEQLDDAWCDIFEAAYGGGKMTTAVQATEYLYEELDSRGLPVPWKKAYGHIEFGTDPNESTLIAGRVARIVIKQDTDWWGAFRPFIVLKQIENVIKEMPMYEHKDQEFWLPIDDFSEITLYPVDLQTDS